MRHNATSATFFFVRYFHSAFSCHSSASTRYNSVTFSGKITGAIYKKTHLFCAIFYRKTHLFEWCFYRKTHLLSKNTILVLHD